MKKTLTVLALIAATGVPLAACAQQSSAADGGPPPAIQQARAAAKTAAFNDLSAADRTKVQAIIDQVNNGQLTDLRAAAQQIDAAISPDESKAVLAERDKLMQAMRANMPAGPDGAAPGANTPGPNGAAPGGMHRGGNDPGRFLLQLGVSREKMRELRHAQTPQQPH
jgi:hypothetical protein